MVINRNILSNLVFSPVLISVIFAAPISVQAQGALEEIIVTAQRREQSLQEVPISIEAYSGVEIEKQGYRNMQELVNFSPTVTVEPDILRASITIRGLGAASADALTIEQSSPTFVDGIHFGRTSQIKLAFMDLQSVEVLKGPQPVYFGQNAIAGAFNLTTRKPTPEWEGYISADVSNNNTQKMNFGAGGPLNDTWGIRVAGTYERSDGYLKDVVTGKKFPEYDNYGGRVILQWNPTDNFQATFKFEASSLNKQAQGNHICQIPNGEEGLIEPQAVLLDPPLGVGWNVDHKPLGKCFGSNNGILPSATNPPPTGDVPPNGNAVAEAGRTVLLNINGLAHLIPEANGRQYSFESREDIDPWNTYLDLKYTFGNGIELSSLTGFDHYLREYLRDNRGTPFYANFQNREEDQYSLSQELRLSSLTGEKLEWMVGLYYQTVDYDIFSDSIRPNLRQGRRYNVGYEDMTWKGIFANLTYTFFDDKMSIDIGGRYSNSDKETYIKGEGAQWIMPCATCPDGIFVDRWRHRIVPGDPEFVLYNGMSPIGMTELSPTPDPARPGRIPGPWTGLADQTELNPQIVLRYRPNDTTSFYAKYAESFKAAGFNTGQATIPGSLDDYTFGPEDGENIELGVKGTLLDGRARYTLTLFDAQVPNLQLASAIANLDNNLLNFQNAGQSVQGAEFTVDWLPLENWALSLSGALMDGVMENFIAPCTEAEFFNNVPACIPDPDDPDDSSAATIDRSGTQAPNTPDWKFVVTSNYIHAMSNGYELEFNAKGYMSDGYITDTNGFSLVTKYNQHEDISASIGFGPQDGPWQLSAYAHNILEARPSYNEEYDFDLEATRSPVMYRTAFTTYGLNFKYNYE